MDIHTKIEELKSILADTPYILYLVDENADMHVLGVNGCDIGDALICIKEMVRAFKLNPTAMAESVIESLAKDARKN